MSSVDLSIWFAALKTARLAMKLVRASIMLTIGAVGSADTAVASDAVKPPGRDESCAVAAALAMTGALVDVAPTVSAATRLDAAVLNWAVAAVIPDAAMLIALLMPASD